MVTVLYGFLCLCPLGAFDCWSRDQKSSLNKQKHQQVKQIMWTWKSPFITVSAAAVAVLYCELFSQISRSERKGLHSCRAQQRPSLPSLYPVSLWNVCSVVCQYLLFFHLLECMDSLCSLWLHRSLHQISAQKRSHQRMPVPTVPHTAKPHTWSASSGCTAVKLIVCLLSYCPTTSSVAES